jgi:hypothetical protein
VSFQASSVGNAEAEALNRLYKPSASVHRGTMSPSLRILLPVFVEKWDREHADTKRQYYYLYEVKFMKKFIVMNCFMKKSITV